MKDAVQKRCERENEGWKKRSARRSIREILNLTARGGGRGPFHHCQRLPYIHGGGVGGGGCWEITGLREEMSGDVLSVQHTLITQR